MPLAVGSIEIPIFARFNGVDTEIGTVTAKVKINASSVIREAQAALDSDPERKAANEASTAISAAAKDPKA